MPAMPHSVWTTADELLFLRNVLVPRCVQRRSEWELRMYIRRCQNRSWTLDSWCEPDREMRVDPQQVILAALDELDKFAGLVKVGG